MPRNVPNSPYMPHRSAVPARTSASAQLLRLLPIVLVFYSFLFLPPEVEITIFGVNFPSYRIALLAMAVPGLWMTMKDNAGRPNAIDAAVTVIAFWIMLSFTMIYGFETGVVRGAGIIIDTALPYFIARVCVKSFDDLRYFLLLVLPGLMFAGGVLALESVSGQLILRPAFASVFGSLNSFTGGEATGVLAIRNEYRIGLMRAYGPFPHPILAGVVMVSFLPLYYFSGLRSWPFLLGIGAALAGFFGLSSAAFLALILAFGAILIYHVKRFFPKISWWMISGLLGVLTWTLHMVSQSGIISVISRLTLTPQTAEYRRLIWEYGSVSVTKNPLFGLGYGQWERLDWMGESVDAHFLLLAMRHGLIVPVLLFLAIIVGMIRLGLATTYLAPKDRAFAIGINVCIMIVLVVGQTVNYFGSSNVLFMSMVAFLASVVSYSTGRADLIKRQRTLLYSRMTAQRVA